MRDKLRVGTRGSVLARTQTEQVVAQLQALHPDLAVETIVINTSGDKFLGEIGPGLSTKGLFIKEIEEALLGDEIDFAVHSMKDLPAEIPDGLEIAAIPKRADPHDALIGCSWSQLPQGASIGTGSPRRTAQLLHLRPDLKMVSMRGNVDTRLRKRKEQRLDAIVLACAGLDRLGLQSEITERLSEKVSIPAPGQGALALETRKDDSEVIDILKKIADADTTEEIRHERAMMQFFSAGCALPFGALARCNKGTVSLEVVLASANGNILLRERSEAAFGDSKLAERIGQTLLQRGARELFV